MRFRRVGVSVVVLVAFAGGAGAQGFDEQIPVPDGAKVSLVFDKPEYFLGETILVHLRIENTGTKPFGVNTGGDYRGAARPGRFHVSAKDEQGVETCDPYPPAGDMGGISSTPSVPPGGTSCPSRCTCTGGSTRRACTLCGSATTWGGRTPPPRRPNSS